MHARYIATWNQQAEDGLSLPAFMRTIYKAVALAGTNGLVKKEVPTNQAQVQSQNPHLYAISPFEYYVTGELVYSKFSLWFRHLGKASGPYLIFPVPQGFPEPVSGTPAGGQDIQLTLVYLQFAIWRNRKSNRNCCGGALCAVSCPVEAGVRNWNWIILKGRLYV